MGFLDLLFPKKCAGCDKDGTYFCASCIQASKLYFPQECPKCGRASVDGITHVRCRKQFLPDGLTSIWRYEEVPRKLVLKLKYKYVSEIALSLAVPVAGELKEIKRSTPEAPKWVSSLILVPIPLHWTRKNWRGFNHVEEVGKLLSQQMGWKTANLLVRTKRAQQQVGLKGKQRLENVQGVFALNPRLKSNAQAIQQDNILLFDDVWTTGATMLEATKVLKVAGFKRVWCLTLAR